MFLKWPVRKSRQGNTFYVWIVTLFHISRPVHDDVMTWKRYPHCWLVMKGSTGLPLQHDDVIKWKHFPRYWPFVRGIHRPQVNSPHKGQWRGALMFSLICVWINGWVNNREAGVLRCYRAHYDVIVMAYGKLESLGLVRLLGPLLLSWINFNPSIHR